MAINFKFQVNMNKEIRRLSSFFELLPKVGWFFLAWDELTVTTSCSYTLLSNIGWFRYAFQLICSKKWRNNDFRSDIHIHTCFSTEHWVKNATYFICETGYLMTRGWFAEFKLMQCRTKEGLGKYQNWPEQLIWWRNEGVGKDKRERGRGNTQIFLKV